MIGKKFGRLTVLEKVIKEYVIGELLRTGAPKIRKRIYYKCKCDCGNETTVSKYILVTGKVKSCWCIHRETLVKRNFKHGYIKTHPRIYNIATAILRRCNNPNDSAAKWYHDKGVKCELGETIGEVVKSLLKIPGYEDDSSIDRIDSSRNYTLYHPEHGYDVWIFEDKQLGITSQCVGNLRWISCSDNVRRIAMRTVDYYETRAITKSFFKRFCQEHGHDFNDYEMIESGTKTITGLVQYYFKKKDK